MSALLLRTIEKLLPRFAYRFSDENELHAGIAQVLTDAGIQFQHEYIADANNRFDFLCEPGIVIEAKIKGSFSEALRQVDRYTQLDVVKAVVLVATKSWAATAPLRSDAEVRGKPVRIVRLRGQSF